MENKCCVVFWQIILLFSDTCSGRIIKTPEDFDPFYYALQGPEDTFSPKLFRWMAENRNFVAEKFLSGLDDGERDMNDLLDGVTDQQNYDQRCDGCVVRSLFSSSHMISYSDVQSRS